MRSLRNLKLKLSTENEEPVVEAAPTGIPVTPQPDPTPGAEEPPPTDIPTPDVPPPDGIPAPVDGVVPPTATPVDPATDPTDIEVSPDDETDLIIENNEVKAMFDQVQDENAALESIYVAMEHMQHLIDTRTCTKETYVMANMLIRPSMESLGIEMPSLSMEGFDEDDIVGMHRLAMESFMQHLRVGFHQGLQQTVLQYKHWHNAIADRYHSVTEQITKYETKLEQTKKEFTDKKSEFASEPVPLRLLELWYHFMTDKGPVTDLVAAVSKDLEMSKYVLTVYPKQVMDSFKKLVTTTKSAKADTEANVIKFAKAVENLRIPGELFDNKWIGEKPYLSVTGLDVKVGKKRTPISLGGVTFTKLAELATARSVEESGSLKHSASKVVGNTSGIGSNIMNSIRTKNIKFSVDDIPKITNMGKEYLNYVKEYLKAMGEFSTVSEEFATALKHLHSTGSEGTSVINQISQIGNNFNQCFNSPAGDEVARSIKGAKYCDYVALRMITNAAAFKE